MIYVSYPKGAPVDDLWDAIWVKGKMRTVSSSHEMATASYPWRRSRSTSTKSSNQAHTASAGGRFVIRNDRIPTSPSLRDCPPSRLGNIQG